MEVRGSTTQTETWLIQLRPSVGPPRKLQRERAGCCGTDIVILAPLSSYHSYLLSLSHSGLLQLYSVARRNKPAVFITDRQVAASHPSYLSSGTRRSSLICGHTAVSFHFLGERMIIVTTTWLTTPVHAHHTGPLCTQTVVGGDL